MNKSEADQIMTTGGWLSRQPASFQKAFLNNARHVTFATDQHVYRLGDASGGIYGVIEGGFGAEVTTGRSTSRLCHILRRYVWFGTGPALTGQSRTFTFRAVEPSSALHLPITSFNELAATDPSTFQRLGALAEENMRVAIHVVSDLLIRSSEHRIAAVILRLSGATAVDPVLPPCDVVITQSELGEIANTSRDIVGRVLNRLEAKGWVAVGYNRLQIVDLSALTSFAFEHHD